MKIDFTKEQYINLLKMCVIANSVLGILGDIMPKSSNYKKKSDKAEDLEDYLLSYAKDFGCEHMTEKYKGKPLLKDEEYEKIEEVMDEYDLYIFWIELETRMGKRDFAKTITADDKKYIKESNGWYPGRIRELYKKYEKEFEKYGIDRLEIKK